MLVPAFGVTPGCASAQADECPARPAFAAGDGATRVTYFIHTDPGGVLPAFAVNFANTVAVPLVIEKVRARLAPGGSGTGGTGH